MKQLLMGTILALVGGLLFVSLASAQAPVEVTVTLSEMKVELSTANVPAGTAVTYVITNNGKLTHEVVLEKEGADDEPLEFGGKEQEAENIAPGATVKAEWTIPEAGRYQLACHIEGHYEAGMKTAFTATVGAAAPAPSQIPKTGGMGGWWPLALGLLGLLALGGGLALRHRKA